MSVMFPLFLSPALFVSLSMGLSEFSVASVSLSGSVSVSLSSCPSWGPPDPHPSTQQALQLAKAMGEELEDLKTLAKSLEERNRSLLAQARQSVGSGQGAQRGSPPTPRLGV